MDRLRICRVCESNSDEKEFVWRHIGKIKQNICRDCQKRKSKEHYYANKESYIARNKKRAKHKQEYVINYLENNPCVDCGEQNIICLEFDHINRDEKSFTIGAYMGNDIRFDSKIKEEIDKCEVRCSNCHRIKTAKEVNSYRYQHINKPK